MNVLPVDERSVLSVTLALTEQVLHRTLELPLGEGPEAGRQAHRPMRAFSSREA